MSQQPRIAPGDRRQLGTLIWVVSRVAGRVAGTGPPGVFTTLGRHRPLFWGWLHFAGRLMPGGRLARVDTELVILRVAAMRGSDYEFAQHAQLGLRAGLTAEDVERVRRPTSSGWSPRQSLLMRVTDSLLTQRDLDDALFAELRAAHDPATVIELLMLVGHYDMLATTLHVLRVPPDRD